MDDQNKNLILATALSFLVILVWFLLFPPQDQVPPTTDPAASESVVQSGDAVRASDAGGTNAQIAPVAENTDAEARRLPIESASLSGQISLQGGRIDQLSLNDYRESLEPGSDKVHLRRTG